MTKRDAEVDGQGLGGSVTGNSLQDNAAQDAPGTSGSSETPAPQLDSGAPADVPKRPDPPSVAVPVGLIIMGIVVGLLIMFSGFVGALTPEPATIDLSEIGTPIGEGPGSAVEVDITAPRGMKLELESSYGDVGACSVKDPGGQPVAIAAAKDAYGNSNAHFTAATKGGYSITCPDTARVTVTNPAASDQFGAEKNDLRGGKIGGLVVGGGIAAAGIAIGVISRRRYDRAVARYEEAHPSSEPA